MGSVFFEQSVYSLFLYHSGGRSGKTNRVGDTAINIIALVHNVILDCKL